MTELAQELMTPDEAAKWFRRSPSWLRQQRDLLHVGSPGGQPLYHVRVCRAYVLGRMRGLVGEVLHQLQLAALAAACDLTGPGPGVHAPACPTASASSSLMAPS